MILDDKDCGLDDDYKFSVENAERTIALFKPLLIGQSLDKILIFRIFSVDYPHRPDECYPEYHNKENNVALWEGPIIFKIGEHQLEIDMWSGSQYYIKLDKTPITSIVDTIDIPLDVLEQQTWDDRGQFFDISCIYNEQILGQHIADIYAKEDDGYLGEIVIQLDNGKKISVYDYIDWPEIKILA